jgi:dolichol-phosphate mannosyltransferase
MLRYATIVVPTYNEEGAIETLIKSLLLEVFPSARGWLLSLLIVDGRSEDRTVEIVEKLKREFDSLFLFVEEKKEGIGAAYVKGFTYAIDKLNAEVVIEFDGDLQHPPSAVLELLQKINEGYDYVVGSRKIKSGGYPQNWGFKRQFLSRVGGIIARIVLFFPFKEFFMVTDPTSGLKATRVKGFLNQIDYHNLINYGFSYKLELLIRILAQGAKYSEIPLRFGIRVSGESKITKQTVKEIMLAVIALRIKDEKTVKFIKFCIVGLLGFVINSVMLEIFRKLNITSSLSRSLIGYDLSKALTFMKERSAWAAALAAEAAIISNFIRRFRVSYGCRPVFTWISRKFVLYFGGRRPSSLHPSLGEFRGTFQILRFSRHFGRSERPWHCWRGHPALATCFCDPFTSNYAHTEAGRAFHS